MRFTDPAIGTGSFHPAFPKVFPDKRIDVSAGCEIGSRHGVPAARLRSGTELDMRLRDFTQAEAPKGAGKFNLVICNPPYVRHHHIAAGEKQRLQRRAKESCGAEINGLAGLYCYCPGLSHAWISEGGLAGWLIPSEFMDVNDGASVKHWLLDTVRLPHIHRSDPKNVRSANAFGRRGGGGRPGAGATPAIPTREKRLPLPRLRNQGMGQAGPHAGVPGLRRPRARGVLTAPAPLAASDPLRACPQRRRRSAPHGLVDENLARACTHYARSSTGAPRMVPRRLG